MRLGPQRFDIDLLFDWAVPAALRADLHAARRARIFAAGHVFGAAAGGALLTAIHVLDPEAGRWLSVLAAGLALFPAYPLAVRAAPRLFDLLALLSLEQLILLILFGAYHYGGTASPFLPWLVPIPIVVLLHFGPRVAPRVAVLGALAAQLLVFYLIQPIGSGHLAPAPPSALGAAGVLSVFSAAIYATIMSLYYVRTVAAQQEELEREIDRRREARQEADRANRAKAHFLANMNHELRTPLNAIIGFSEIMGGELLGPVGTAKYLSYSKDIAQCGRHLLKLIGEIIDLARIDSGNFVLIENDFDLSALADMTARQLRPLAEKGDLTIQVSGPSHLHLRGDEPRIKQVLMNLLANAVKFSSRGSSIKLTVAQDPAQGAIITIADTGVGIQPADMPGVMQPFEQMAKTAMRSGTGAGLALPLARELIMQHGGTLTLDSAPGRGTTAVVTFPVERVRSGLNIP
jgi:signal transduction histidine kinase